MERYDYDPERAAALLDEAGWTDSDGDGIRDRDGKKLSFYPDRPGDRRGAGQHRHLPGGGVEAVGD